MATPYKDDLPFTIDQVVTILGLTIYKDRGNEWLVNCPFCLGKNGQPDRHGHMSVSLLYDRFKCYRCGRTGGKLQLYAMLHNTDNQTAYRDIWEYLYGSRNALHRSKSGLPPPSIKPVEVAPSLETSVTLSVDEMDNTYRRMLEQLTLTKFHRENLLQRGLPGEEIDRLGYRSVPAAGLRRIAMALQKKGCTLEGVPGLYVDDEGAWKLNVFSSGIIMPSLDPQHRITGLQVRKDRFKKGKCYWITSRDLLRGCRNVVQMHFCERHSPIPRDGVVHLTEGIMKADITAYYSGWFMLSVAGTSQYPAMRNAIQPMKRMRIKKIVFDFDMDMYTNPSVLESLQIASGIFEEAGFEVAVDLWDRRQKGIDDLWVWSVRHGQVPKIETHSYEEMKKIWYKEEKDAL